VHNDSQQYGMGLRKNAHGISLALS